MLNKHDEIYYCVNCGLRVSLDVHGRCGRCGSVSVQYDILDNSHREEIIEKGEQQ